MSTIIVNVIIILGIIIAGGFLIFFVGDLLLSIVDPNGDVKKMREKRKKDVAAMNKRLESMDPDVAKLVRKDERVSEIMDLEAQDRKQELENGGTVET